MKPSTEKTAGARIERKALLAFVRRHMWSYTNRADKNNDTRAAWCDAMDAVFTFIEGRARSTGKKPGGVGRK